MNLSSSVSELPLVGPVYKKRLRNLGIKTVKDFLYHIPNKYNDFSHIEKISRVRVGDTLTVQGTLNYLKNQYTKSGKKIQIGEIEDSTGKLTTIWFNQPFLTRTLFTGTRLSLAGKIDWFGTKKALISPEYEILKKGGQTTHTGKIVAIYPETYGVSSKWIRSKIRIAYDTCGNQIKEYLPQNYGFVSLPEAIKSIHFPHTLRAATEARRRLAFDELFFLQKNNLQRKLDWQKNKAAYLLRIDRSLIQKFTDALPFTLTHSQDLVVNQILSDLQKTYPMNRLLGGDVGSGKTVVAAFAAFITFVNGFQTVIMAPTQILAQQHFNTLNNLLQPFKVRICLVTASDIRNETGRSDIFVGTHALIHQKIIFDKVALVVIDEQHKFGVEQREHLIKEVENQNIAPHVLTMTATPIPRTVALTFYGDLEHSTLTEIPGKRKIITTWIVPPEKRNSAYKWIKTQINENKAQVFVVCPLIEESVKETMKDVKAVTAEYEKLAKFFGRTRVGLLHGQLNLTQKERVIDKFRNGNLEVLVTTPVIEVGIDIPNATIIVIEGADRFGLAQLHQLRGRVGRGETKSYCLLFPQGQSEKVLARLEAMGQNLSGSELAELDLKLRGPGEIFGFRQHGIPDLKIASWQDIDLIKKAKEVVQLVCNI